MPKTTKRYANEAVIACRTSVELQAEMIRNMDRLLEITQELVARLTELEARVDEFSPPSPSHSRKRKSPSSSKK